MKSLVVLFRRSSMGILVLNGVAFLSTLSPDLTIPKWLSVPLLLSAMMSLASMLVIAFLRSEEIRQQRGLPFNRASVLPLLALLTIRGWIVGVAGLALLGAIIGALHSQQSSLLAGAPERRDGRPVLVSHGRVLGVITEEEYENARREIIRDFAAIAVVFSWLPFVYLWFTPVSLAGDHRTSASPAQLPQPEPETP
jgi:hypothetical protein